MLMCLIQALDGDLAVGGNSQFYASAVPSGSTQEAVSTSSDNVGVTFQWQQ
jgi:ribonuclease T2